MQERSNTFRRRRAAARVQVDLRPDLHVRGEEPVQVAQDHRGRPFRVIRFSRLRRGAAPSYAS